MNPMLALHALLFAALLFAAGCASGGPSSRQKPAFASLSVQTPEILLAADRAFAQFSMTRGAAPAFAAFAAPNAVLLPNGGAPVSGPQAIQAAMAEPPTGRLAWQPAHAELAASGDLGFTYGFYEFQPSDGPRSGQVVRGKYTTIWRRQPDGTWKFLLSTANLGPQ